LAVQTLVAGLKFLTIFGALASRRAAPESIGRAAIYFVLVGCFIGLFLATCNYVLQPYLNAGILSIGMVTFWIVLTGAGPIGGLRESFASLGTAENATLGLVAVVLVILFKYVAAETIDEIATFSLFLTPVLGRWGLLIFLYGYAPRFDETTRRLSEQIGFLPVLVGTAATLGLATYFLGRRGLWIALVVSISALVLRELLFRRRRVIAHSDLGATVEISEALSLLLLTSL
jgi:cobalamin synthase